MYLTMVKTTLVVALISSAMAAKPKTKSSGRHKHVEITDQHVPWSASDQAYNQSMKHFSCGTSQRHASADFNRTVARMHQEQQAEADAWSSRASGGSGAARARLARRAAASANQAIQVSLYMHIVASQANSGMVTQSMITQQASVLNSLYNPYNIHFTLQNTTVTINDNWAIGGGSFDVAMKTALRQGSYNTLNLYFQTDLAGGVLGYCTLPGPTTSSPSSYVGDGCNIAAGTMPGGPIMGYNLGKTAVHETGHWLGLLHTFENYSCSGPGDYVTDTPVESQSTSGCPTNPWKNSCPRKNPDVYDPIHNYMDYSIDSCYARFSAGQQQRMFSMFAQYRQAYGGGLTTVSSSPSATGAAGAGASSGAGYGYGYSGNGAYNNAASPKKGNKQKNGGGSG